MKPRHNKKHHHSAQHSSQRPRQLTRPRPPHGYGHGHSHGRFGDGAVKLKGNEVLIYGRHSARHALLNPRRVIREVYATPQTLAHPQIAEAIAKAQTRHANANNNTNANAKFTIHSIPAPDLNKIIGDASPANQSPTSQAPATQGIVLVAQHLPSPTLAEWLDSKQDQAKKLRVVLGDQLQDGRNIGGILRSLWAFGGDALITTHRHAPPVTSALLKAASGAGEYVGVIGVGNLSQAIKLLQEAGFFVVGLDASSLSHSSFSEMGEYQRLAGWGEGQRLANKSGSQQVGGGIGELAEYGRLALVVGSEGAGLRQLTRRRVDQLVSIPMQAGVESLNASVATAIALFVAMHGVGGDIKGEEK